jgi:hypothetical protein
MSIVKNTKKLFLSVIIIFALVPLFAFDWPQLLFESDNFFSFFGEPRGTTYTNSIQFRKQAAVTAADSGTVLISIRTDTADMGWFPSTLGNAIILSHKNDMMTVYGNLEKIHIADGTSDITEGNIIGESGSSGWQNGFCSLEFQVIDTKLKTVINPLNLMPQVSQKTTSPVINDLKATSDSGTWSIAHQGTKLNAGIYSLYIAQQPEGMTFKTSVAVNGAETETITYNILKQDNNRLCFTDKTGKRSYPYNQLFPDKDRQFIAEVILSKGKNTISITVSDVFGNEKTATYTIEVI